MLLDPMGGIVITNDGNCILREVDVSHPTAKSMIELSRAQDEVSWQRSNMTDLVSRIDSTQTRP